MFPLPTPSAQPLPSPFAPQKQVLFEEPIAPEKPIAPEEPLEEVPLPPKQVAQEIQPEVLSSQKAYGW